MRTLFIAAAAFPVFLVSCESPREVATPERTIYRNTPGELTPFAGGAPPSASYVPPERYYAFGGGFSASRRQTEGDDYNFLQYNDHCHRHWGHRRYCGSGYGSWGGSCYHRSRCW